MDTSFTIKPRDTLSRVVHDRASTVRTDLAPSQSVSAAAPVPAVHAAPNAGDMTPPHVAIHPNSQDVLHRMRDEREKRKHPPEDEALSRARAYGRQNHPDHDAYPGQEPQEHADIQV